MTSLQEYLCRQTITQLCTLVGTLHMTAYCYYYTHCTAATESEYNMQGRIGGDASLTPAGQVYAAKLFEYMQQLYPTTQQQQNGTNSNSNGSSSSSDSELVVWTSTMVRTGQTVSYMLGHYEIVKWKVVLCILSVTTSICYVMYTARSIHTAYYAIAMCVRTHYCSFHVVTVYSVYDALAC